MGDQPRLALALRYVLKGDLSAGIKGEMKNMTKATMAGATKERRAASGDPLGPNSEIGRKLKQYYDELVSDNVPDRFAQLLSQLERAEPAQKKD
jgi:hypothetical protein